MKTIEEVKSIHKTALFFFKIKTAFNYQQLPDNGQKLASGDLTSKQIRWTYFHEVNRKENKENSNTTGHEANETTNIKADLNMRPLVYKPCMRLASCCE